MLTKSSGHVIGLSDILFPVRISKNVNEETLSHTFSTGGKLPDSLRQGGGSSGRTRTYDQSVNSRPLYH